MKEDWQIIEMNDKYLHGDFTPDEKDNFVSELKGNKALEETFFIQKILANKISGIDHLLLNKNLNEIHSKHYGSSPGKFLHKLGYALIPIAIATLTWLLVFKNENIENPRATVIVQKEKLPTVIEPVKHSEKGMVKKKALVVNSTLKIFIDQTAFDTLFATNVMSDEGGKKNKDISEYIEQETLESLKVEASIKNSLDKTLYDTLYGTNLILNGDFTGLKKVPSGYKENIIGRIKEGEYKITDHSTKPNDYFYPSGDHTSGQGMMMALNGAKRPQTPVWMSVIPVQPETYYQFSIYIMNVQNRTVNIYNHTDPFFILRLNGKTVTGYQLPEVEGTWFEFKYYWYSAENKEVAIKLIDKKIEKMGNDFCIDDISFRELIFSKEYIPKSVFFDYDKFELNESALEEVDGLISYFKDNKDLNIEIRGFTDHAGDAPYNKRLSEKRAKAVADYMIAKGITHNRLNFQGEGEDRGIDLSEQERRRVQITIFK